MISEAGVMGYPAKKRHPAATAPSARASLPCIKCNPGVKRASVFRYGIFDLLNLRYLGDRYGQVGAEQLAFHASRAGIWIGDPHDQGPSFGDGLPCAEYRVGTYLYADAATFAPPLFDLDPMQRNPPAR